MREVLPLIAVEKIPFKSSVEALVFADRLGMIGTAMAGPDAQTDQPHSQRRVGMRGITAPRAAIVHQQRVRQAIAAKGVGQGLFDSSALLIGQSLKAKIKARVIVKHGQRMGLSGHRGQPSFEIHLPKTIGHRMLKALPVGPRACRLRVNQPMTMKDRGDGTAGRHRLGSPVFKQAADLSGSPGGMALSQLHNRFFLPALHLARKTPRTARKIGQSIRSSLVVAANPFVAGLTTDAKTLAELAKAHFFPLGQSDKLFSQRHEINNSPGHTSSPIIKWEKIMPLTVFKVLPMSPVHLLPMCPVYTAGQGEGKRAKDNFELWRLHAEAFSAPQASRWL